MIKIDLSEIKYNEKAASEIAKRYGLDKVRIIKPECYNDDFIKETFNIENISISSGEEIRFQYKNLKFYIKLELSDNMFIERLTLIFILINYIDTYENIYDLGCIQQLIYNMFLINKFIDIVKIKSIDKKIKMSITRFMEDNDLEFNYFIEQGIPKFLTQIGVSDEIVKSIADKINNSYGFVDEPDDEENLEENLEEKPEEEPEEKSEENPEENLEDQKDNNPPNYFIKNTYFYFKIKCKLEKEISFKNFVYLIDMKKDIDENIMPKIHETIRYNSFNTHDFLSKYLCDVFSEYQYEKFENF